MARARSRRAATAPSRTPLLEFRAAQEFRYGPMNASPAAQQSGAGGGRYLTTSRMFAEQVLARHPAQFRILSQNKSVPCVPRDAWPETGYRGRRVLFLLPGQALGNNVCILLFLQAFLEQCEPRQVGVFCAQSASDIFLSDETITTYGLWLPREHLKRWDAVVDLGHLESRRNIELWPVDMEADLLAAFGLEPCRRYSAQARPVPRDRPLRIGVLPLASSPLRTIPPETALAIMRALAPFGEITLCLNRNQQQGRLFGEALDGKLEPPVRIIDAFESIGALLKAVAGFDYIVAADSGPAHMSKLFGVPGTAIYTSAPGEVLQGRFRNLQSWTVPFAGAHCRAPCGLAKVRQTAEGAVGCMGSLGVSVDDLPNTPAGQQPGLVTSLTRTPVPCVAMLRDDPAPAVEAIVRDVRIRLADSRPLGAE